MKGVEGIDYSTVDVKLKIDGTETEISFGDLIKGYSTEQSLSKKGRELGDARKDLEKEYQDKLAQLDNMSKASLTVLYSSEKDLAEQYHKLEEKITEARKDNDSYNLSELKDEREQVQKEYWTARNKREQLRSAVQKQAQEETQKAWNEQIQHFNDTIPTMIPGKPPPEPKSVVVLLFKSTKSIICAESIM